MTLTEFWQITAQIFAGVWTFATTFRFFGFSPIELTFACGLIIFVIRKIIKPVFGGDDDGTEP